MVCVPVRRNVLVNGKKITIADKLLHAARVNIVFMDLLKRKLLSHPGTDLSEVSRPPELLYSSKLAFPSLWRTD